MYLWCVLAGVVPPYNDEDTCGHVRSQRKRQFSDLRRALLVSVPTSLHHPSPHVSKAKVGVSDCVHGVYSGPL